MKLLKINTDHYIIVDDSEIKEGDWVLTEENTIHQVDYVDAYTKINGWKKITHSTQPLGFLNEYGSTADLKCDWTNVKFLPISEVKELLGEIDVEKKAKKDAIEIFGNDFSLASLAHQTQFKRGYNQALEDNKDKKYTEGDMEAAVCFGMILERLKDDKYKLSDNEEYKGFISSLQPKTEWEVEIIDGQLKQTNNGNNRLVG